MTWNTGHITNCGRKSLKKSPLGFQNCLTMKQTDEKIVIMTTPDPDW